MTNNKIDLNLNMLNILNVEGTNTLTKTQRLSE